MDKIFITIICIRESPIFDMQHGHALKKFNFDHLTQPKSQGMGRGVQAEYLLQCCSISCFPFN